jgi:hypothetical protein
MEQVRVVLLSIVLALVALLCAYGAHDFFFPPYTDAEIELSFVDTWEVSALITALALVLLAPLTLLSALLRWGGSALAKRLSSISLALAIVAGGLLIASHIALTERTTRLTGQDFGGFYGLF